MQEALENRGIKHALNLVGNQDKYQIRVAIIIALQYIGPSLFIAYLTYAGQFPGLFSNNEPTSPTESLDTSNSSFLGIEIDWHLRYWLSDWTESCVAGLIGVGLSSFVSDYFGRTKAMLFSYTLTSLSILFTWLGWFGSERLHPNVFSQFIILGTGGYISVSITYLSEIGSERFARVASAIAFLVLAALGFILTVLSLEGLDIRTFYLVSGIPIIFSFFGFHFLDETPMFLYQNKETEKALQTLEQMAIVNNKFEALGANVASNGVFRFTENSEIRSVQRWNYLQILKDHQLKYRVLIYSLIRLFISLAFWALFPTALIRMGMFILLVFGSLAEIIGSLVSLKVYAVPTRSLLKKGLSTVLVICFSFLLILIFSADDGDEVMFKILAWILSGSLAFMRGYIYNLGNELFPVEVRSQCNGIAEIIAQSGEPLGHVLLMLAHYNLTVPWLIIGAVGLASLGLSVFLPKEEFATLEKSDEIELNLDEKNPKTDAQPLITNSIEYSF